MIRKLTKWTRTAVWKIRLGKLIWWDALQIRSKLMISSSKSSVLQCRSICLPTCSHLCWTMEFLFCLGSAYWIVDNWRDKMAMNGILMDIIFLIFDIYVQQGMDSLYISSSLTFTHHLTYSTVLLLSPSFIHTLCLIIIVENGRDKMAMYWINIIGFLTPLLIFDCASVMYN